MIAKPEILFLAHRIPYPPDKGDKIRSWRLLKHLTERFSVHLACFVDDQRDLRHMDYIGSLCASSTFVRLRPSFARVKSLRSLTSGDPLTFSYYHNRKMLAAVNQLRTLPLAAEMVFSSSMAPYVAARVAGRKRIVDFCDADSEKWRQYAAETSGMLGWLYTREADALARAETQIVNWADVSFAITDQEAALFNRRPDCRNHVGWWSNGVDSDYFDPALAVEPFKTPCDVAFVGAMDYRANVDAVLEFINESWPKVRAAVPRTRFAIVGANPVGKIKALHGFNGVSVTGRVDDVRPWLTHAKVIVAPMRVARGIQNKVLEAMAMAKPVVATPAVASSIACDDGAICVAQNADEMAMEIINLLERPERCRQVGAAARAAMGSYDWGISLERFDTALDGL